MTEMLLKKEKEAKKYNFLVEVKRQLGDIEYKVAVKDGIATLAIRSSDKEGPNIIAALQRFSKEKNINFGFTDPSNTQFPRIGKFSLDPRNIKFIIFAIFAIYEEKPSLESVKKKWNFFISDDGSIITTRLKTVNDLMTAEFILKSYSEMIAYSINIIGGDVKIILNNSSPISVTLMKKQ